MKSRKKTHFAYIAMAGIILLLLILFLRPKISQNNAEQTQSPMENLGSGFLEVETFPKDATVFVDGINKGISPLTMGNVAAGVHDIVIKKEGYKDFLKQVEIKPGKRAFLEARLVVAEEKSISQETIEEKPNIETAEDQTEIKETEPLQTSNSGKINLGKKFLLYYDFSGKKFEETRPEDYDIFSKRYVNHITFTRANPAQMKIIRKNIADVEKEDCGGISGSYGELASGQSVCVITKEGLVAAVGSSWAKTTENAELTWKVFN